MTVLLTEASNSYVPRHDLQPRGTYPWCAHCDTDSHLFADSPAVPNRGAATVAVAVHCSRCRRSRVLETTAAHLAALPAHAPIPHETQGIPQMTNHCHTPHSPAAAHEARAAVEHFDLTPAGLADAPAQQLDLDSLVHTGNS